MRQRIIVDKNQLDDLPNDLVDVKSKLVSFLDKNLHKAWDIYVYPFMNGDRPNLVLFNPFVGMQFIEIIFGKREDYTFEEVIEADGIKYRKYYYRSKSTFHLVGRVRTYRDKLMNLYLPQIREQVDKNSKILAAFSIGIYFPEMTTNDAKDLISNEHCSAFGYDELDTSSLDRIVKDHKRRVGFAIQPDWVDTIEEWLNPLSQEKQTFQWEILKTQHTSQQRIFPNWQNITRFRTPRTKGEIELAKVLDEKLPHKWEIFIEPFLNGDRPDFALLHPEYGMWIIEVKDWNPNNYERHGDKLYVKDNRGRHFLSKERRPEGQLQRYQENLSRLAHSDFGGKLPIKTIKYAIYLHNMSVRQAEDLFAIDDNTLLIGHNNLLSAISSKIIQDNKKLALNLEQFKLLRSWLLPPQHFLEQIQPLILDKEQLKFAKLASRKHQLLQGIAGSGKSLVLAQRAANLAEQGKRVLVISFNITLWHYLRDLVARTENQFERKFIEFNHFHGFCRDFLKENGIEWTDTNEDSSTLLDVTVPNLVLDAAKLEKNAKNRLYDAILIDEGQDYLPLWYETLCAFLSKNDEVLIVADPSQNVYRRNLEIQDPKLDPLSLMQRSYRLPGRVREQSERFAQIFFPDVYIRSKPVQIGFEDPLLIWRNIDSLETAFEKIKSALFWLMVEKQAHISDITILVPDHQEGNLVTKFFRYYGLEINHIFENKVNAHNHKSTFEIGVGKLKICTAHSFKGWELSNIIIITPTDEQASEGGTWSHNLFYAALTRVKQNLIVFNRFEGYKDYGSVWKKFD